MSISSINYSIGASYGAYNQKLTQATKSKLEKLGIPYNINITEEEGQRLLKTGLVNKNESSKKENFQESEGKNSLLERAKQLAEKLGIQTNEETTFQELLTIIENTIENQISVNKNNMDSLKTLRDLSNELASLQSQSSGSLGFDSKNQALMTSLELLGEYNKNLIKKN